MDMIYPTKTFHGREYYAARTISSSGLPFSIMASSSTSIIEISYKDETTFELILTEWVEVKDP